MLLPPMALFHSFLWLSSIPLSEKAMAPHSSTLAWRIPWTEEPSRLQSMGSLRVGHDWVTSLFTFHFHALEKEMATHSSVLAWRIPGMGAWWAAVYGVAQGRTRLKRLSSSSSSSSIPLYHIFFIHLSVDKPSKIISMSWLLWIVLLWTYGCVYLFFFFEL